MTEELRKIYDKAPDNQPQASDEMMEVHRNLNDALDRNIDALQVHYFAWGHELGRKAGAEK